MLMKQKMETVPANNETIVSQISDVVSQQDVEELVGWQKTVLSKFEKTNETLVNCNAISEAHFEKASRDVKKLGTQFREMYKDLNSIFTRIRVIKQRLAKVDVKHQAPHESENN